MNPLVILSGGRDALLARETSVYIYIYVCVYTKKGTKQSHVQTHRIHHNSKQGN